MMKAVKRSLLALARNNIGWFFLKPFSSLGTFLLRARENKPTEKLSIANENKLFKKLTVLNGPFKGMKYPSLSSVGSSLYPKLLGSYEKELWPELQKLLKNKYSDVIDIGCAEGFYAVGLSLRLPRAQVVAYDTNKKARRLCTEMAELNNVAGRIEVRKKCTAKEIYSFIFKGRGLVVCDCEGYEKELFNLKNVQNLKNCDLIIETHDLFDITISSYLKKIFSKTHDIVSIKSIDDLEKARSYDFKELKNLSLGERKLVLAERRDAIMEWLVCTLKL